jgi:dihydrofolate synthase/folylpolyglutamate synthase
VEVGLGGRLDSTNIINPDVSLITNIGYDHMDLLGDTLPRIAFEKAGIIKSSGPVVISERQEEVEDVFTKRALLMKTPIYFATDQLRVTPAHHDEDGAYDIYFDGNLLFEKLSCELKGVYQQKNLAGVLGTLIQLKGKGYSISESAVREGVERVVSLTKLKGRWQKIGERPLVVCDTGHNRDGIFEVLKQIRMQNYKNLHIVIGIVKDKDLSMLDLWPPEAHFYFCQAQIPRALPAQELGEIAARKGLKGDVVADVNEALARARSNAGPDDLIFIGGSTFVVAELVEL